MTLLLKNSDFVLRNSRALNFAAPPYSLGFRPSMISPSSPCFSPFSGLAVCGQEYRSFRGNDARPKAICAPAWPILLRFMRITDFFSPGSWVKSFLCKIYCVCLDFYLIAFESLTAKTRCLDCIKMLWIKKEKLVWIL